MSITTSGTSITFNDATTQTTAFTGGYVSGLGGQVFTASGTFPIPTGVTAIKVTVVGGGGGGAAFNNGGPDDGKNGGGGGYAVRYYTSLTPANTLAVTVGGAGTAGAGSGGASGGAGGDSIIASGTQSLPSSTTASGGGAGTGGGGGVTGSGGTTTNASYGINGDAGGKSYLSNLFSGYGLAGTGGTISVSATAGKAGIVIIEW